MATKNKEIKKPKMKLEKVKLLKDYPPKKAGETIEVSELGKQLLIKSKHI